MPTSRVYLREITALREALAADAALSQHQLDAVPANYRDSARITLFAVHCSSR